MDKEALAEIHDNKFHIKSNIPRDTKVRIYFWYTLSFLIQWHHTLQAAYWLLFNLLSFSSFKQIL